MNEFEREMADTVIELLREFGFSCALSRDGEPILDRDTLRVVDNNAGDPIDALAAFFDPTTSSLSGFEKSLSDDYILSKKWVYLQVPEGASVETGDTMVSDVHGVFTIDMATAVGPSYPIYWKAALNQSSE